MSTWDEDLIRLVDQRIAQYSQRRSAVGTCVTREVIGWGASVLFDGATTAVPVKVLGHVELQPGMRCTLDKYGSEWLVTGAFAVPQMGEAGGLAFNVGVVTTSITTFADHTGLSTFTFQKFHDNTAVEIFHSGSGYATVQNTTARWALRLTQTEGETPYTPVDLNTFYLSWSTANERIWGLSTFTYTGIPAGIYTGQWRWRRAAGTGVVTNAGEDFYSYKLREVVRASSPYL